MLQLIGLPAIKSIQAIAATINLPADWYTGTQDITLATPVDPARSLVILASAHPLHPFRAFGIGADIVSTTAVRLYVNGGPGNATTIVPIRGQVLELREVRSRQVVTPASNTTTHDVTINAVDPAKSFVIAAGLFNGVNAGLNASCAAWLHSATQVRFECADTQGTFMTQVRHQIIEMK